MRRACRSQTGAVGVRGTRPFVVTAYTDSRGRGGGHRAFLGAVHPEGDPQVGAVPGCEALARPDEDVLGQGRWEKRHEQHGIYWGDAAEQRPAVDLGGAKP